MALGTNYKRNQDAGDKAIAARINRAKELAKELNGNLGLASSVVLGRKTIEQVRLEAADDCPDCEGSGCAECDGPEHRCA